MTVTNYTFDFLGMDVSTETPMDVNVVGTQTGTGSITEFTVKFTYSFDITAGQFIISDTRELEVFNGKVTLTLNDTPDEEFFSNIVFNIESSPSVGGVITLVRSETSGGGPLATPFTTTIPIAAGGNYTAPAGTYNLIRFTTSSGKAISLNSIKANIVCYLEGTGIATEKGTLPVEDLRPGDRLLKPDGGVTEVKWLGVQPVAARFVNPRKVNPICVTAGAIADNVPSRDLYVSPDHAIGIDGMLINAGALVNGRSIYQVAKMPLDGFTYYHVETDAHELILAEGCAAETFIDYAGRDSFVNGDERADAPTIAEMDRIRISSVRLLPDAIKARLAGRASALAPPRRRVA